MSMSSQTISLHSETGTSFSAYLALPENPAPSAGLLLLQYICGVNQVMRRWADEFARQGYVVMVPDMYWRQEEGVQLIQDPARPGPGEMAKAMALNDDFNDELATLDMQLALQALRAHPRCDGRAGTLGYCLGGRLAYLAAARTDADCSVGYYAVNLENYLDEAPNIRRPLLLHMAGEDVLVPEGVRTQICSQLASNDNVQIQVYPKVNHAFALPGGPNYDKPTADQANAGSLEFLRQHLPAHEDSALGAKGVMYGQ